MVRIRREEIFKSLLESWRVRHQVAQRDGRAECWWDFEVKIIVDVAIKVEFSLLHQLHHGGPGKEFRDGARTKERVIYRHRLLAICIREAVSTREQDIAVLHDEHHCSGNIVLLKL